MRHIIIEIFCSKFSTVFPPEKKYCFLSSFLSELGNASHLGNTSQLEKASQLETPYPLGNTTKLVKKSSKQRLSQHAVAQVDQNNAWEDKSDIVDMSHSTAFFGEEFLH